MRGVFGAERQLLNAAHRGEINAKIASINGHFSALLASAVAGIIAHVRGRIAQIDPTLPAAQRLAAIELLQAEQAASLARLQQDIGQERRMARRAAVATLTVGHRTRRRALFRRHTSERVALTVMIGAPPMPLLASRRKRDAVRRIAMQLPVPRPSSSVFPGTR